MAILRLELGLFDIDVFPYPLPSGHGGGITIDAELWRTDANGMRLEDLTPYFVGGTVDWRYERGGGIAGDPNGTALMANLTLSRTDLISPYADFLAPMMMLTFDDGRADKTIPLGIFTVTRPSEEYGESSSEVTFECRDLTHLLAKSTFDSTYTVTAGTEIDTALRGIIESAGTAAHTITDSTRTTGYARSYRKGSSRLVAANKLAHAFGWYRLFAGLDGRIRSLPYRSHAYQHPVVSLTDDDFVNLMQVTPIGEMANVVQLTAENPHGGEHRAYFARAVNNDARDPLSTVSLGREIVYQGQTVTVQDVESLADLKALAAAWLEEARSAETTVQFQVSPDTPFGMLRTVTLNTTGSRAHLAGHYRLKAWSIGFSPDEALLTMECARVVTFGQGAGEAAA